ncbi:Teneurin-3 [Microtus ochrogaster]|uniref:Teneurin-3 n=1 Tax=Microtus ochrogaster TaxID=79684 RepID=A0A8J6GDG2_MICOH|nr:Teneurin-3 [Microtus ochrogaster]
MPGLANQEILAHTVFNCKKEKLEAAAINVLFLATNCFPYPHLQYDFVELLDGSRLIAREQRNLVDSERAERAGRQARSVSLHEAGFIQYLDSGIWHLAFYNDGKNPEPVSFNTIVIESVVECPRNCHGNGECVSGTCHCFPGFLGPDCSRAACPVLCSGNGQYSKGRCLCFSGWKGTECDVPTTQCIDPQCGGRGICIMGSCACNSGYKGENCEEEICSVDCGTHGVCMGGTCRCEEGWTGPACNQRACHPRCAEHGTCKDGKCECSQGWNGEHCTIGQVLFVHGDPRTPIDASDSPTKEKVN